MVTKTANPFLEHVVQVPSLYNGYKLREVNNIPQVVCPHCSRSHPTWDLEKNRAIKVDGVCDRCNCPLEVGDDATEFMQQMAVEGNDPALRELGMRLRGELAEQEASAEGLFTQAQVDELVERTKQETREAVEEELTAPAAKAKKKS